MTEWTGEMEATALLVCEWYERPGNSAGGALHIVLDDDNIETEHIRWSYESASISDRVAMWPLVTALRALSEAERFEVTQGWSRR